MSRRAKVAVGAVLGTVVAANLFLLLAERLAGGPAGPASSSYATAPEGVAAYASLLERRGHSVLRLREPLEEADLDPRATLVLLDPGVVSGSAARRLADFVAAGGRLVAGGEHPGRWTAALLDDPPAWGPEGPVLLEPIVPLGLVSGVESVSADGVGVWEDAGEALPVLAAADPVVVVATRGRGTMILLADTSVLHNRHLGRADNAAFALAAAGGAGRPVHFVESVHGYGTGTGLRAVPRRWAWSLGWLALAALLLMWARGRRLGPPESETRDLPPPRREYVESLAAVLARTKRPGEAARPLQHAVRERLAHRAALPPDAGEAALRAAGPRLGLTAEEVDAALAPVGTREGLVAAGRALARLEDGRGR